MPFARSLDLLRRLTPLVTATALSLPATAMAQGSDSAMRTALEAARSGNFSLINESAIRGHELHGYVEYYQLRERLPAASPQEVLTYISANSDAPTGEWMREQAIIRYGKVGNYANVLAVANGEPPTTEEQCYYYTAQLSQNPTLAAEGGRRLWRVGKSQPDACDTLFSSLRSRGEINDQEIWQRMMLAWENDQSGLVSHLGGLLGPSWSSAVAAQQSVATNSSALSRVGSCIGPNCAGNTAFFPAALKAAAHTSASSALASWQQLSGASPFSAQDRQDIEREIMYWGLRRDQRQMLSWIDQALPRQSDPEVFELRTRLAIRDGDWAAVERTVGIMPAATQGAARWQYWLGRALEQRGQSAAAQSAFAKAASQRDFFAFVAADRLGQPYNLNMENNRFSDTERAQVAGWPSVRRTNALLRIGQDGLANLEWKHAVETASPRDARLLADYAVHAGQPAMAVQATIYGKMLDALPYRFPAAYRDNFMRWGQTNGVDPYLLMGIARRESAYNPGAISPAGARGLMQLMPGTASLVGSRIGIGDPGWGVLEPDTNIRLGSTYIRNMLDRYSGNRIAAAAAYNAGPGRVDDWLRSSPGEFDLFVEHIPFKETRRYVRAVLEYRVVFESLANNGSTQGVSVLTPQERNSQYSVSLMASR
ncbi:transglycosylase SLT domain-containing protein [Halomonas binhaiensis]|uniref:Transglycosylase SLT domain-containing protein n=1 Tax=Halomonas binhaiensis TaxID=2562282 RepID=A0A5C1NH31_9GAMM|nr:transglycosylase SLT domain-containing protein [Halomonas binhaiensis]QEM82524.1 transglycosylase SLT domain-containing protein [Halomonas binhaiensis]